MLTKEEFLKDNRTMALYNLDIKLKKYLNFPNGFFIEAGANDGITQSNTKIFADYFGWKGLLVEPHYETYLKCKDNRPESIVVHGALVSSDYKDKFIKGDFNGSMTSSVAGMRERRYILNNSARMYILKILSLLKYRLTRIKNKVPVYTLEELLRKNNINKVDFISLDVEGYELEVFKGLNFETISPQYILCEVYIDQYDLILKYLTGKGYEMVENLSNYNKKDFPNWDGSHNDYLFRKIK